MNIENELRTALRRESPAPGFAQRVAARIEREDKRADATPQAWPSDRHGWRRVAAAITMTAVLGGSWAGHAISERRRAERARSEVLLALHIASVKMRYAQQEVRERASDPDER